MKRLILAFAITSGAFLCAGCWNGRLLICAEQPFWTTLGDNVRLRVAFAKASLAHGYIPRFLVLAEADKPLERLAAAVGNGRFGTVVVGPLLSLAPERFASAFPRTEFILIEGPATGDALPNTVRLLFDRADAFRTAGYAAGLSVREETGAASASALGRRIGILLPAGRVGGAGDAAGFTEGVAAALDGSRPVVKEILEPVDRAKVRAAVEQMRKEGVEIFFPRLAAGDPWCLEALQSAGGCAVVADWAVSGAFPEQVFLSVENDVVDGVLQCLGATAGPERVVNGSVRLLSGGARAVPAELKAKVGAR